MWKLQKLNSQKWASSNDNSLPATVGTLSYPLLSSHIQSFHPSKLSLHRKSLPVKSSLSWWQSYSSVWKLRLQFAAQWWESHLL